MALCYKRIYAHNNRATSGIFAADNLHNVANVKINLFPELLRRHFRFWCSHCTCFFPWPLMQPIHLKLCRKRFPARCAGGRVCCCPFPLIAKRRLCRAYGPGNNRGYMSDFPYSNKAGLIACRLHGRPNNNIFGLALPFQILCRKWHILQFSFCAVPLLHFFGCPLDHSPGVNKYAVKNALV